MSYLRCSSAMMSPANTDRIVDTVKYYSNGRFPFGVLSRGTCFFPRPGFNFRAEWSRLADELANSAPNFAVREMDDGNYVVRFGEYVFVVVFRDEFEAVRESVAEEVDAYDADEEIEGTSDAPADHFLIGVYGRTRFLCDLENGTIVEMIQGG